MENTWSFKENVLFKAGMPFLSLPSTIEKIVELQESIVVLLESNHEIGERNIFCFDLTGQVKWQIAAPHKIHTTNDYTGLYLRDGSLCAYNRTGVEYKLNAETGEIISSQLIR